MKKFYIFDFDGTLVNTFYDSVLAYNKALKHHGLTEYQYDSLENIDFTDFINNMTEDMEVLETYSKMYENSTKKLTKPYAGIREVLEKLKQEDKELAICSNRKEQQLIEYAEKLFPDVEFKYVIGYTPGGAFKPNPALINQILEEENYQKEEILYVGDKTTDIQTAENVDIDVVIVKWGQGNEEAYTSKYPLGVISKPEELLNY